MTRILLALSSIVLISGPALRAAAVVTSASGANAAAIQSSVDSFRSSLGSLNPNVIGSFGSGRREINWDGVPAALSSPNAFPANFFNSNSPRGTVFSTPGTGFQVSGSGADPVRFDNINPTYSTTFSTFSPAKLFTSIGSNIVDVNFFVPGGNTPAVTNAFGAVFADVDLANVSSLQFFDVNNNPLGLFYVPTANNGLSFLGVSFSSGELISRVRLTAGNTAVGPNDGANADIVVADDFIYGEPAPAVPEPSTYLLLAAGLSCLAFGRRRSKLNR